eukprot:TRINITY_DN6822_c0_g1_i1.p1 TRINITY_DN6822_c0_g1~~TRINITY_DN6822_c0_g1_i1.p1  ORF type:complete len:153 (+),score=24.77 TRINITY_DN6822_c0_g1_i1:85-543(+)
MDELKHRLEEIMDIRASREMIQQKILEFILSVRQPQKTPQNMKLFLMMLKDPNTKHHDDYKKTLEAAVTAHPWVDHFEYYSKCVVFLKKDGNGYRSRCKFECANARSNRPSNIKPHVEQLILLVQSLENYDTDEDFVSWLKSEFNTNVLHSK